MQELIGYRDYDTQSFATEKRHIRVQHHQLKRHWIDTPKRYRRYYSGMSWAVGWCWGIASSVPGHPVNNHLHPVRLQMTGMRRTVHGNPGVPFVRAMNRIVHYSATTYSWRLPLYSRPWPQVEQPRRIEVCKHRCCKHSSSWTVVVVNSSAVDCPSARHWRENL